MNNGRELEQAVKAIETAILQGQELGERVLEIEANKRLVIADVLHEIDVYVRIKLGNSYDSTYIFECKNLAEPVGKNAIVDFSEKIRATNATRGFFVAPEFGKYAIAQAKLDSRLALLNSAEHKISPIGFQCFVWTNQTFTSRNVLGVTGPIRHSLASPSVLAGRAMPFSEVMSSLGGQVIQQRLAQPDLRLLSDGTHPLSAMKEFAMPLSALSVEGVSVSAITILVKFDFILTTPKLLFGYDVKTRGAYFRFERFQIDEQHGIDGLTITGWDAPPKN